MERNAPPPPGTVIGIDFITMLQHNHWFFVALLACIMLGLSIVGPWPTRVCVLIFFKQEFFVSGTRLTYPMLQVVDSLQ
jgi:hypothetical protein